MTAPDQLAQEAKRLADEVDRMPVRLHKALHTAIDALAQRAESAEALVEQYRTALLTARDALASSYDVSDYPANGKTKQDKAIAAIDAMVERIAEMTKRAESAEALVKQLCKPMLTDVLVEYTYAYARAQDCLAADVWVSMRCFGRPDIVPCVPVTSI